MPRHHTVQYPDGYKVTLEKIFYKARGAFDMVGGNETVRDLKPRFPGYYKLLINLTLSEHWLWWTLVDKHNRFTNMAYLAPSCHTEATKISVAYKLLSSKEFIIRLARNEYLINPFIYFPQETVQNGGAIAAKWFQALDRLQLKQNKKGVKDGDR